MKTEDIIRSAEELRDACDKLQFGAKVHTVYNPLEYAWEPYEIYLRNYALPPKRSIFIGMNPGPWGMAQTGIPFGEIRAVNDWLGIEGRVRKPAGEIPKRPVLGFECGRSEVSGRRVWGLMRDRYGRAELFARDNFIGNYCPLLFFDGEGKNLTPDKLVKADRERLFALCDGHVRDLIRLMNPHFLIGFGKFAESRLESIIGTLPEKIRTGINVLSVLHPSPANPRANKGWAGQTESALLEAGVWNSR